MASPRWSAPTIAERATAAAEKLVEMAWQRREIFFPDLTALDEAIRIGLESEGLTLVSDAGDAPTGGSAADSPAVLKALLAAGADEAPRLSYLTLCDPGGRGGRSRSRAGRRRHALGRPRLFKD